MSEEKEKEEMTMEELYEGLRAAAIFAYFEKKFGPMPHPLRIFKFRRWMRDFEAFREGVECCESLQERIKWRQHSSEGSSKEMKKKFGGEREKDEM